MQAPLPVLSLQCNVTVEVTSKLREGFLEQGRVYAGWHSFKCKDWVDVLRCFNCYGYGHGAYDCNVKGKQFEHSVFSSACPVFAQRLGWITKVIYGF